MEWQATLRTPAFLLACNIFLEYLCTSIPVSLSLRFLFSFFYPSLSPSIAFFLFSSAFISLALSLSLPNTLLLHSDFQSVILSFPLPQDIFLFLCSTPYLSDLLPRGFFVVYVYFILSRLLSSLSCTFAILCSFLLLTPPEEYSYNAKCASCKDTLAVDWWRICYKFSFTNVFGNFLFYRVFVNFLKY